MDDPRFKHVATDPRFKAVRKRERKVKIDSRFNHMFTDRRFKVQYHVDKRGRKVKQSSSEDLRKYYQLEGEDNVNGETEQDDNQGKVPSEQADSDNEREVPSEQADSDNEGEVPSEQSDSDSSDDEAIEYLDNEVIHDWGGHDDDVSLGQETSSRLALCNMDWDRINAQDVYVLANSFKPSGGSIASVDVYPSDFGLEKLAKEEILGPTDVKDDGQGEEGSGYSQEKLRKYQLDRMKYYYAVIECDSVSTAEAVYEHCDGLEYEHSGGQLDLRFIPTKMTFTDRQSKSSVSESTLPVNFNPVTFVSSALQQSKVHLTWDETDPHRLQTTMKKFSKEDAADMDFSAYMASSSDSDESHDADKYRDLLGGAQGSKGQPEAEELEITWEPGLKENADKIVKRRKKELSSDGLTPWEKYLQEKRKKKKEKRKSKEIVKQDNSGFDDEFFQHDVTMATVKNPKKIQRQSKDETEEKDKQLSELELLMMDNEDKQHFNMKDILNKDQTDSFEVDVKDSRFDALYESHVYAPDPAHPHYKRTKAMEAIMDEKMKRRKTRKAKTEKTRHATNSLDPLVNSIKNKTKLFNQRKAKKRHTKTNV